MRLTCMDNWPIKTKQCDNMHTTSLVHFTALSDLRGTSMWKPVLGSFSPRRAGSSFLSFPSSQSIQTSRIARRTLHNNIKIDVECTLYIQHRTFSWDTIMIVSFDDNFVTLSPCHTHTNVWQLLTNTHNYSQLLPIKSRSFTITRCYS